MLRFRIKSSYVPLSSSFDKRKISLMSKISLVDEKNNKEFEENVCFRSNAAVFSIVSVSKEQRGRRRFCLSFSLFHSLTVRDSFFTHIDSVPSFWHRGRFAKIGSASPDRLLPRFLNDSRLRTIRRENGNGRRRNVGVDGNGSGPASLIPDFPRSASLFN